MAADPTLADRLDEWADLLVELIEAGLLTNTENRHVTLRAAAVRLRKLDAIEEAVGDPTVLDLAAQHLTNRPLLAEHLRCIADALGGTEP